MKISKKKIKVRKKLPSAVVVSKVHKDKKKYNRKDKSWKTKL